MASSAEYAVQAESLTQAAVILLVLRAFSSGCSALTGVEAVANGVPAFRKPKVRNAQTTLALMGGDRDPALLGPHGARPDLGRPLRREPLQPDRLRLRERPQPSLMAQVAAGDVRHGLDPLLHHPGRDGGVLLLAANTAFNGFPLLGSVLARDGYAPKALNTRGDRLVYSNGMIILGIVAIAVLIIYQANLTTLIQLYIIGVFVSFSLGQIGMIRHWRRRCVRSDALAEAEPRRRAPRRAPFGHRRASSSTPSARALTVLGARHRHDHEVHARRLARLHRDPDPGGPHDRREPLLPRRRARDPHGRRRSTTASTGDIALILVNRLQKPVAKAIDYALAARHDKTIAIHVAVTKEEADVTAERSGKSIGCRSRSSSSSRRTATTRSPIAEFIKKYRE